MYHATLHNLPTNFKQPLIESFCVFVFADRILQTKDFHLIFSKAPKREPETPKHRGKLRVCFRSFLIVRLGTLAVSDTTSY